MIKYINNWHIVSVLGTGWYDEIVQLWYNVLPASQTVAQTLHQDVKQHHEKKV